MFFWFVFFCLFSCFVLNHDIRFVFALHLLLLLFLFFALVFCYFLIFGYLSKNISRKIGNSKTDILTRAASTGVLTSSVYFSLWCVFIFCRLC